MMRRIESVVVLGAGTMGSRIAAHLANAGVPCSLLDIAPASLTPEEQTKGLALDNPAVRNRVVAAPSTCAVSYTHLDVYKRQWLRQSFGDARNWQPRSVCGDDCGGFAHRRDAAQQLSLIHI